MNKRLSDEITSAREAVSIDLDNSPKKRKGVAHEYCLGKHPSLRYNHLTKLLSPNSDLREPTTDEYIDMLIIAGNGETFARYVNGRLGFKPPERIDEKTTLHDDLEALSNEIADDLNKLHEKLEQQKILKEKVKPVKLVKD